MSPFGQDVSMVMTVLDRMAMGRTVMGMGERMRVQVRMVSDERVTYHQHRTGQHDDECHEVHRRQVLAQEDE